MVMPALLRKKIEVHTDLGSGDASTAEEEERVHTDLGDDVKMGFYSYRIQKHLLGPIKLFRFIDFFSCLI